jgi:extracellular factor (EF) 3-hydroxypalmitic acid methyl ester biosynthesis protein
MATNSSPVQNSITFQNSQGETARGTLMKLSRTTLVLEVYNPYSIVQLSEVMDQLTIYRQDRIVYQGRAVVYNLVNTGLMLIVSATLIDKWSDLSDINEQQGLMGELDYFIDNWAKTQTLYSGYQLIVGRLRSFLYELSLWMEQVGLISDERGYIEGRKDEEVLGDLVQSIMPLLRDLFEQFEVEAAKIPGDEIMSHKLFAQHDLHPLLMRSPFIHRTFTKPLGFAGDYEMVNMMTRSGWEGPTSYAKIVNFFQLQSGPAQAHRNRLEILYQHLKRMIDEAAAENRKLKILNIACGPAIEIQRLLKNEKNVNLCEFVLLDFSDVAIDYVKTEIEIIQRNCGTDVEFQYLNESVHTLLKQAHADEINLGGEDYDLVYCAGLFDYLSDRICERLLRLFFRLTRPGGRVLATNVDPSNGSVYAMEHLLEWYLIYRDKSHLASLGKGLGQPVTYEDETGINIFMEINKLE